MSSRLLSLPTELLQHIFDTIEASESYECQYFKTYVNLSLTSRRCRSLVTRYVFNQLIFRTAGFRELERELADCAQALSHSGCTRDVQSFHIRVSEPPHLPGHFGAQEGARAAELLKEFPNMKGVLFHLDKAAVSPNGFVDGVKSVLGDGCCGSVTAAGGYYCHWYAE